MKPRLKSLLRSRKEELKSAHPKSRDRIRQRVKVLSVCEVLRRKVV